MEVVLVSRKTSASAGSSTVDYTLKINLGDSDATPRSTTSVPSSEWSGNSFASSSEHQQYIPVDPMNKLHALPGFSPFGSGLTNEFATWTMGRETFLSSAVLMEQCEDDIRSFAEQSDHTEGFMLTTPISDGFGGFASSFLETLRDEFPKSKIFSTAMLDNSLGWKREDTERSRNQRILNEALSIQYLEEFSSMILPIQGALPWIKGDAAFKHVRDDISMTASYSQIVTAHLQSLNSELRESDVLSNVINQLNWRGDNKIAHLSGASPLLPPSLVAGPLGLVTLKSSIKDFSIAPVIPERKSKKPIDPRLNEPFAQYSIVRGYEGDELETFGPILESTTALREPLSTWICLPDPYYLPATSLPIFDSLTSSGRPLPIIAPPIDPFSPPGLFSLPPTIFPTPPLSTTIQPSSIPILTTLSTTPSAHYYLASLANHIKELQRVRSGGLTEFVEGEYSIGKEGIGECRERLESLVDALKGAARRDGEGESSEEGSGEEDEDWGMD